MYKTQKWTRVAPPRAGGAIRQLGHVECPSKSAGKSEASLTHIATQIENGSCIELCLATKVSLTCGPSSVLMRDRNTCIQHHINMCVPTLRECTYSRIPMHACYMFCSTSFYEHLTGDDDVNKATHRQGEPEQSSLDFGDGLV